MAVPEKDFFTLDEIVQRWRLAGMDHATLLKLAADDLLVFSVYIRDLGSHTQTKDTTDGVVTTSQTVAFSFRAEGSARPPLQYLKADDARRLLESKSNERIAVRGHYSLPTREKESGLGHAQAPLFCRDDLLVSRIERDRFERQHRVRLRPPWFSRAWGWLSDQANQRALTMLSGWIAAIFAALWAVWLWWYPNTATPRATPNQVVERTTFSAPRAPTATAHDQRH
jgi:hypothetical protein